MDEYEEFDEEDRRRVTRISQRNKRRKFNKRLDTEYLYVEENDDSFLAQLIRLIAGQVSRAITPQQLIATLFIIAAYTIVVLAFAVISDLLFISFETFGDLSGEASIKLGAVHDAKQRAFGIMFAIVAIMVELDKPFITQRVAVFKPYILRSILLLCVATLSEPNPMMIYEKKHGQGSFYNDDYAMVDDISPSALYNSNGDNNNYDGYFNNYYGYNADSKNNRYSTTRSGVNYYTSSSSSGNISDEMPNIVMNLQLISSRLLHISVLLYFVSGLLCLDQFEPQAFVPNDTCTFPPDHLPKEIVSESKLPKKKPSSRQIRDKNPEQREETHVGYHQYNDYVEYGPGYV